MGINVTEELLEKIDNYLNGLLSIEDSIEFEKKIESDPELKEIVIIQEGLFTIHNNENSKKLANNKSLKSIKHYKEQINKEENQKLLSIIKKSGENYHKSKISKNSILKYSVAATVAILFSTLFYFNSSNDLENYYETNLDWNELPSYSSKGNDSLIIFTNGEKLFREKKFDKAIASFHSISKSNKLYPYSLMYIGASYEQLNQNQKAIETFKVLSEMSNFEEYSRGYWYQLLIYLKLNNKAKAQEIKALIIKDPNNYNYEKAKSLDF